MLVSEKGNRALYILAATVQDFIYNVYVSKEHNNIVWKKNTILRLSQKKNTIVQMGHILSKKLGHFQINMIQAGGCDKCI
jgi:hypothetical protein